MPDNLSHPHNLHLYNLMLENTLDLYRQSNENLYLYHQASHNRAYEIQKVSGLAWLGHYFIAGATSGVIVQTAPDGESWNFGNTKKYVKSVPTLRLSIKLT